MTKHRPLKRTLVFTLSLLFLLLLGAGTTQAKQTAQAFPAWEASYWNNTNLAGPPVLQREEDNIDYDWGLDSPHPVVNADDFSARWVRIINLPTGTYRFTATVDDGMRVWIDDSLIIDVWYDSQEHSVSADTFLLGGDHQIRVEYYDTGGQAVAQLRRQLISGTGGEWLARYYNNTSLSGDPVVVRNEPQINFSLLGSPAAPVSADNFSAMWTRDLSLDAGRYRFTVTADDGVRLWVNDQFVLDEWRQQAATTYTVEVDLPGGLTPVRMEYFENEGVAVAQLTWDQLTAAPTPAPPVTTNWRGEYYNNISLAGPPALVRDDAAINFTWGSSSPAPNIISANRFSVRWTQTFDLAPGSYDLTMYADDGARVYANGQLLIDAWEVQPVTPYSAVLNHNGGEVTMVVEYFENTGLAEARLVWSPQGGAPETPTTPTQPSGAITAQMTGAFYLNVREGPGLTFDDFDVLRRNQTVPVIGRDRFADWVEVVLPNGDTGWVSASYMSSSTPFVNLPITN